MTEKESNTLNKIGTFIQNNNTSDDFLVKLIELSGSFLNLKTVSNYAKDNKLSYNGAKNYRKTIKLFNVKFIIDNL